jgi:hypothetical protein
VCAALHQHTEAGAVCRRHLKGRCHLHVHLPAAVRSNAQLTSCLNAFGPPSILFGVDRHTTACGFASGRSALLRANKNHHQTRKYRF